MRSSIARALSVAAAAALPVALVAPAHAVLPKPPGGGGASKTVKSSCAWSLSPNQPRFGQAYVTLKFQLDKSGNIFPVMWTVRDDSAGLPSDDIAFKGSLVRVDGKKELFAGPMGDRETRTGSPTAVRLLPGEKISYSLEVVDGDWAPDPLGMPTCTGTIKVPSIPKK